MKSWESSFRRLWRRDRSAAIFNPRCGDRQAGHNPIISTRKARFNAIRSSEVTLTVFIPRRSSRLSISSPFSRTAGHLSWRRRRLDLCLRGLRRGLDAAEDSEHSATFPSI
jgi:hypothetical protein